MSTPKKTNNNKSIPKRSPYTPGFAKKVMKMIPRNLENALKLFSPTKEKKKNNYKK